MLKKNVVAIIPARGNSKRIPGKNCKKFNGKLVIVSTIEKLKKSRIFDKIIVSTDSKKIALLSRKYGAEIPFIRPKRLANDKASGGAVMSHGIRFLIKEGYKFDYACFVFAPNPFLRISDLKKGYKKIKKKRCNYVFSATPYRFPYFRSFIFSKKFGIKMIFPKNYKKRSQELKQILCDAGQFYWGHKRAWLKEKIAFSGNSDVILVPEWRYHDLDTLADWKRAETFSKFINKF
jgi:N-acylneuraminate cytidylyltransferase|tara:strand:- start:3441 stop:4142 length:702 start_codon:yes stop_codon:yes gene_type:complete